RSAFWHRPVDRVLEKPVQPPSFDRLVGTPAACVPSSTSGRGRVHGKVDLCSREPAAARSRQGFGRVAVPRYHSSGGALVTRHALVRTRSTASLISQQGVHLKDAYKRRGRS